MWAKGYHEKREFSKRLYGTAYSGTLRVIRETESNEYHWQKYLNTMDEWIQEAK
jgi:hypothetical protein